MTGIELDRRDLILGRHARPQRETAAARIRPSGEDLRRIIVACDRPPPSMNCHEPRLGLSSRPLS